MSERTTVCLLAHVPEGTEQQFLQYIRDYDTAHPDCHFEMIVDRPHLRFAEMIEMLRLNPKLDIMKIMKREQ